MQQKFYQKTKGPLVASASAQDKFLHFTLILTLLAFFPISHHLSSTPDQFSYFWVPSVFPTFASNLRPTHYMCRDVTLGQV